MRNTVLGFSQELAIEYNLTLNDLLLLQYIMYANGTPTMSHIVENDVSYVWINHAKIHEDLPILNISEQTLKNKLVQLKSNGFISSKSIANNNTRGSKAYYTITEKTLLLLNTNINNSSSTAQSTCTSTASGTSYNKLNNNKLDIVLSKDNTIDIENIPQQQINNANDVLDNTDTRHDVSGKPKPKYKMSAPEHKFDNEYQFGNTKPRKSNLYDKCIAYIYEWTNDKNTQKLLIQYLDLCMEMQSIRGFNQWKGMLDTTLVQCEQKSNGHTYAELIQLAIEYGWKTFHEWKDFGGVGKNKKYVSSISEADYRSNRRVTAADKSGRAF